MRQKRYPLMLDVDYPPERLLLQAIQAIPEGEGAGFLRTIVLLGHREMLREVQTKTIIMGEVSDDAGTH